jgi:deoxyribodipyrimidine photo-lyase
LPWELGADFFFRHLMDADPASNTLSWRWVAGLQTVGKTYLVRISNIEKHAPCYLEGSNEGAQRLADSAVTAHVVTDTLDTNARPLADYPTVLQQSPGRTGLWLHPDDLTPEIGPLSLLKPVAIAACICEPVYRETFGLSPRRIDALETVLQDGLNRAQRHYGIEYEAIRTGDSVTALVEWARRNRLNMVVGFAPMVGPTGDLLARLERELGSAGIGWKWVRRSSDVTAFGLASAGFFPFWQKMSRLLRGKAE